MLLKIACLVISICSSSTAFRVSFYAEEHFVRLFVKLPQLASGRRSPIGAFLEVDVGGQNVPHVLLPFQVVGSVIRTSLLDVPVDFGHSSSARWRSPNGLDYQLLDGNVWFVFFTLCSRFCGVNITVRTPDFHLCLLYLLQVNRSIVSQRKKESEFQNFQFKHFLENSLKSAGTQRLTSSVYLLEFITFYDSHLYFNHEMENSLTLSAALYQAGKYIPNVTLQ